MRRTLIGLWARLKRNRFIIAVFVITIVVALLPLFTTNCINGHDTDYHLLRIEALKTGILNARPFLRVNMLFFGGEGYASSMFYPDFLLYIPALLRTFGVSINLSYHIFVGVCVILTTLSSYYSVKYIAKSRTTALIAMIIITLYQYHIDDIYTRAAVGEFTAAIFVPVVLAGIYDLMYADMKRPWILGLGMTGVVLCHTLTTLFCIILCFTALIIYGIKYTAIRQEIAKRARKDNSVGEVVLEIEPFANVVVRLIFTALIVIGITAFYWAPMMEQMLTIPMRYSQSIFDLNYEKLLLKDVFKNINPGMGIAPFLLLLPGIIVPGKKRKWGFPEFCLIAGILAVLFSTGFFPWKRLGDNLKFIQFPWRSFVIAGPLLAIPAAIYLRALSDLFIENASIQGKASASVIRRYGRRIGIFNRIVIVFALAIMVTSAIGNIARNEEGYYSYSDDYYDHKPFTEHVISGEWLPLTVKDIHALTDDCDVAYTGDKTIKVSRYKNELEVGLTGNEEYVDVPFVYYKGYAAVSTADGKALICDGEGDNGRVRVYPDGAKNIRVYYKGTIIGIVSTLVSLGTLILCIVLLIMKKRKKK